GVDAEIVLEQLKHRIRELHVAAIGVRPAVAHTLWSDEDRTSLSKVPEPVEGVFRRTAVASFCDLRSVPVPPVIGHDETIGLIVIVVVRNAQDVLAVLPAAHDVMTTVH